MKRKELERSDLSALHPLVGGREYQKLRQSLAYGVLKHVILAASTQRNPADLLLEVYLAGLWHGAEIGRKNGAIYGEQAPAPRVRDVINV